jgi:hypothetical protein
MTRSQSRFSKSLPGGVVGWCRRRVLPKLAHLCAILGVLILGLWITGRVLTDRFQWSQYLWWIPAIWMIASGWGLLVTSVVFDKLSRRSKGLLARALLLLGNIGCTGYLIFGVWHMHRMITPSPSYPDAIKVVHWNQSAKKVDVASWAQSLLEQSTDIVLVTNSRWGSDRRTLLENLAPIAPSDEKHRVTNGYRVVGQLGHFRIDNNAFVASRFPIVRTGQVHVGSYSAEESSVRPGGDLGWVLFAEFDLSSIDPESSPFIVWFVDLPSDPLSWRQSSMHQVVQAIQGWNGRTTIVGESGWTTIETADSFPQPDLVIGDFNTLRGSASLDLLAPNMSDAFSQAGVGRGRSWSPKVSNKFLRQPIKLADWHIDLSLVGPNWRVSRYELMNTRQWGWAEHRIQKLDLLPRKKQPR